MVCPSKMRISSWDKEDKRQKLKELVLSVLYHPLYNHDLEIIMKELALPEGEVIRAFIDYDLDIFSYDNDIYSPLVMRFVLHLHNLLEGSWHITRQEFILSYIQKINPKSILDLGFGVPSRYIKYILRKTNSSITLCDISDNAVVFAKTLLKTWKSQWDRQINFLVSDMADVSVQPPYFDLYLFQDSIEHVKNPTICLKNFVQCTPKTAQFLLSLPIGPLIPMHNIAWATIKEANLWLEKCGIAPIYHKIIRTNPHVDLFASEVEGGFLNYIVLCNKL